MITTESRITRNGRADSALTCSAPVGPDFATNGELTAANPFVVYGERPQLIIDTNNIDKYDKHSEYQYLHILF